MASLDANIAVVFPGQGSQKPGMFDNKTSPKEVILALQEASEVLQQDLFAISNDPSEINKTEFTQPILLCAGVGTYREYLDQGGRPAKAMAGHSLGEYSALVCAESIKFADAISLVHARGKAMQESIRYDDGTMAAVLGLTADKVIEACKSVNESVWVANINSPEQIVISGYKDGVDKASAICKEQGAKRIVVLPVSIPSHCPIMTRAISKLDKEFNTMQIIDCAIPVIHNATNSTSFNSTEIKVNLLEQLVKEVDWVSCVNQLMKTTTQIIECGPNKVLHGLNRRIAPADKCLTIGTQAEINELLS